MSCCNSTPDNTIIDDVKEYYGKRLKQSADLQTGACTTGSAPPKYVRETLGLIHEEVVSRYYGCGLVIPQCLTDMKVLDLGSGSGRDVYALSKLVGKNGHVTGVDMTDEQLEVARKYVTYHAEKFGYEKPNVAFVQGYIEKLLELGIPEGTFDIIVSNCVVNLSPDKKAVLQGAYSLLKEGGELYFSDVYADSNLPDTIRKHKVLWGECIAGALWWQDLVKIAEEVGFTTTRLVHATPLPINNDELQKIVEGHQFVSAEYRLFKLPAKPSSPCQVIYKGGVLGSEETFQLDYRRQFKKNEPVTVDEQTASILQNTRFADWFSFQPLPDNQTQEMDKENCLDPFLYISTKGVKAPSGGCCGPSKKSDKCAEVKKCC
ncbi:arsenite methyltransferase [Lingula anatina]|uniref:Arsenite methyltransferase n=1 Tax=Lingula anatina TaxID=7574 RepID=A0A1S3JJA0_LINAN|nr:arsenite methyltransferase [Lingula anatina]XP_013410491.1 arsenite methyltransferase [Lingula anatina]XP_013410492.1 arsenite methyltransferase [Lingula anatina]|eukprot:XP_013410490.1 arsenite methyltransferase [Lingula anatina]